MVSPGDGLPTSSMMDCALGEAAIVEVVVLGMLVDVDVVVLGIVLEVEVLEDGMLVMLLAPEVPRHIWVCDSDGGFTNALLVS